jgi:CTP:molybdopterin cytidylyltransferase MocA
VIAAILLAAGESTRMGRAKALLPWDGVPLVAYQARELLVAGVEDVVVVLGHGAAEVREALRQAQGGDVRVVVNEAYREGRASSLRAGAAALADGADPIVVLNVDQPRSREVLSALLSAHAGGVTMPVYQGKRGHPALLAGTLLPELRSATEEAQGLRGVLAAHEVREIDLGTAAVRLDINTEEDYRRALAGG